MRARVGDGEREKQATVEDVSKAPRAVLFPCQCVRACVCVCVTRGVLCEAGRSNLTETGMERQQSLGEGGRWRRVLTGHVDLSSQEQQVLWAQAVAGGSYTCWAGLSEGVAVTMGTSLAGPRCPFRTLRSEGRHLTK